jgi:ARG and Rhodanese-Phosphatase-superfamily-associated Protein domain
MNFRAVLLVLLIVVFAVSMGAVNFASLGSVGLEQAQADGSAVVTQNTAAGTVPHTVTITNNGTRSVNVKQGQLLESPDSQDLVVAENVTVNPGTNSTVKTYCTEPGQKANPGSNLTANQTANEMVMTIIQASVPSDAVSARQAQLKIWTLKMGGEVDPYTGEAAAMVQSSRSSYYQLRQDLSAAKGNVSSQFNLNNETLKNVQNLAGSPGVSTWLEDLRNWFAEVLGI